VPELGLLGVVLRRRHVSDGVCAVAPGLLRLKPTTKRSEGSCNGTGAPQCLTSDCCSIQTDIRAG
jgi:hypothetical protein